MNSDTPTPHEGRPALASRQASGRSTLIAEVYDLDKLFDRRYRNVEYYRRVLRGTRGRVLELACGTGRFLVRLLEDGLAADGLDHSPEMLEICRRHCRERGLAPTLYECDMANFHLPESFEVILIAAGAMKELDGREAASATLRCCYEALVRGGRLYVDLVPPRTVSCAVSPERPTEPGPMRHWRRGDSDWTLQPVGIEYDSARNRSIELVRYERWHKNVLVEAELHEFCVQHWTMWEFETLLAEAGFSDVVVTADHTKAEAIGPNNATWTFLARRQLSTATRVAHGGKRTRR